MNIKVRYVKVGTLTLRHMWRLEILVQEILLWMNGKVSIAIRLEEEMVIS